MPRIEEDPSINSAAASGTLFVVEELCTFSVDRGTGTIVIESLAPKFPDQFEDLKSVEARQLAVGYAVTRGVADARINDNIEGPYPVNKDGVSIDEVGDRRGKPLPPTHPDMQPAAYRANIKVTKRLL